MSRSLTIVMYHYVRDLRHSRYPDVRGLPTEAFRKQIVYIKKQYQVIGAEEVLAAVETGGRLPPRALLLTFDDGYVDHFTQVFPILNQENLPGCFFPPAKCVLEHRVLDVNKIHFVLASVPDKEEIVDFICRRLDAERARYALSPNTYYWKKLAGDGRFDAEEVIFIKRLLQRELPEALRKSIIDALFETYVGIDEATFARELYMSLDQIKCLHRNGMYVGSHGYGHHWLNTLDEAAQAREVDRSMAFLERIGTPLDRWIMCYPYGAYDETLLSLLRRRGCTTGFTTKVGVADLRRDDGLTLPRLDTNDLPKEADAPLDAWTHEVRT